MNDFLTKLLGLPQGSPGIGEALSILNQDRIKKQQEKSLGTYNIPMVNTSEGFTDSYQTLNDLFKRTQMERANDMGSIPTEQELAYSQPIQQEMPIEMPTAQPSVMGTQTGGIPREVLDYATGYRYSPGGEFGQSRLNEQNLSTLWNSINTNYPDLDQRTKEMLLANLVAVAQAESGMGGAYGNPNAGNYKDSNFWNWFAGGDRNFDPESFDEMANIITKGIGKYTLGTGGRFTRENASTYTGNDNLGFWYDQIYNPAMRAMGY